jgi:hypothetical protein
LSASGRLRRSTKKKHGDGLRAITMLTTLISVHPQIQNEHDGVFKLLLMKYGG